MYHHIPSTAKKYVGRSLQSIERINEETVKLLFTDGGVTSLIVLGDCCSYSMFYEIDFPKSCKGSEILSLEESVEGDDKETAFKKALELYPEFYSYAEFYSDCLRVWDVVFKTKAGEIRIKHINASNGYYDGSTQYVDL